MSQKQWNSHVCSAKWTGRACTCHQHLCSSSRFASTRWTDSTADSHSLHTQGVGAMWNILVFPNHLGPSVICFRRNELFDKVWIFLCLLEVPRTCLICWAISKSGAAQNTSSLNSTYKVICVLKKRDSQVFWRTKQWGPILNGTSGYKIIEVKDEVKID